VKIDFHYTEPLRINEARETFRVIEQQGYSGIWLGEVTTDPLLGLAAASTATSRVQLGTGVSLAFVRSPMSMAYAAHDLQVASDGRFILGIGSQVRGQIERRFGVEWSHPAERMREYIEAMKAVWACWNYGEPLNYQGKFYKIDLMPPYFTPAPSTVGPPPVHLGAFGARMTVVAGQVAEGLLLHSLMTPKYCHDVVRSNLEAGLAARELPLEHDFELSGLFFVATGRDEKQLNRAKDWVRGRIAFYGSTRAYRDIFAYHGWLTQHETWHEMARRGEWQSMADFVDDEMLHAFAVVGDPGTIADGIRDRAAASTVDRVSVVAPDSSQEFWPDIMTDLFSSDER